VPGDAFRLVYDLVVGSATTFLAGGAFAAWWWVRKRTLLRAARAFGVAGLLLLSIGSLGLWALPGAVLVAVVPEPGRRSLWRRNAPQRVDPSALGPVWARLLREGMAAAEQFDAAVKRCRRGPLRDSLDELRAEARHALRTAGDHARRGDELDRARRDLGRVRRAAMRAQWRAGAWRSPSDVRVVDADRSRREGIARLDAAIAQERAALEVCVARLVAAACEAAELAAGSAPALPTGATTDGTELLDRLTALRGALAEVAEHRP